MLRLAIIADDLTGALDTGIKFSKMGIGCQIITGDGFFVDDIDHSKEILVIDTETRHVHEQEAYSKVYSTAKLCVDLGIKYFYKKTDSALRGHIGSELAALDDVTGEPVAFVPALPRENRCTREGIHYINGTPVAQSNFGSDPLNPVRQSSVSMLIHEESALSVANVYEKDRGTWPDSQVAVFDASTRSDLEEIADRLVENGHIRITAGCAGFAEVLAEKIPFLKGRECPAVQSRKLFVVCGSINDVTKKQVLYAGQKGFRRICLTQGQKLDPDYLQSDAGKHFKEELKDLCGQNDYILIDGFTENTVEDTLAYAREKGISTEDIPEIIAGRLGEISAYLLTLEEDFALMVIGGDTLYSFISQLDKPLLDPLCEPVNGTVLMQVQTKNQYFPLVSKSGGFGQENLIIEIANYLKHHTN